MKRAARITQSGPRRACGCLILLAAMGLARAPAAAEAPYQAMGTKVGEVTARSAIIWARLTLEPQARWGGFRFPGPRVQDGGPPLLPGDVQMDDLDGACAGTPGRARLIIGTSPDLMGARRTPWVNVGPETDFTVQFHLTNLKPNTEYFYAIEARDPAGEVRRRERICRFVTAPRPNEWTEVTFVVITGQLYRHLDDPKGFKIYPAMGALSPSFLVATGDTVYYDGEPPRATSVELARHHWHRMYALPRLVQFHRSVPGYWIKDDHDTWCNDCWPGMATKKMGDFTFAEGQAVFLEQVPMSKRTHRTFRWGKGLQIWLPEGRDFRSPNNMPDGPEKTIWGEAQKQWLKRSILASDAAFRIMVSATPMVGPDRPNKRDNHANAAFATEGDEFRRWVRDQGLRNFFVVCGDRHWQYASVHPETGLWEFSCGPASDEHAGGTPGEDPTYHRFHRVNGGFLSVTVTEVDGVPTCLFRHHDVDGNVVFEHTITTAVDTD